MEKSKYFTSLDHYSRKDAKVELCHYLMSIEGWTIFGYKPNESDSMQDYSSPAGWDGIASYGDFVLVVDKSHNGDSGKDIIQRAQHYKPCDKCLETGAEPGGWTYERASQDPGGFWAVNKEHGKPVLVVHSSNNYVPRDFFLDDGQEKCQACRGRGEIYSHTTEETVGHWPKFQSNPRAKGWHLEKNGSIVTSGQTIARMYRSYWEGDYSEQKAQVLQEAKLFVDALMIAMAPKPAKQTSDGGVYSNASSTAVGAFEIIEYSEKAIAVAGDTKPIKDKLSALQGRFNPRLTHPSTGEKFVGWIFSKTKRADVERLIQSL